MVPRCLRYWAHCHFPRIPKENLSNPESASTSYNYEPTPRTSGEEFGRGLGPTRMVPEKAGQCKVRTLVARSRLVVGECPKHPHEGIPQTGSISKGCSHHVALEQLGNRFSVTKLSCPQNSA